VPPAEATSILAFPLLAWAPKILYALFINQFPICGSRAKSYLILCGVVQMVATLILAMVPFGDPWAVAGILFVFNLAIAFGTIVTDGLMVE